MRKVKLFKHNERTNTAIVFYYGKKHVLYSWAGFDPNIEEIMKIIETGYRDDELLGNTREWFDKHYSYEYSTGFDLEVLE